MSEGRPALEMHMKRKEEEEKKEAKSFGEKRRAPAGLREVDAAKSRMAALEHAKKGGAFSPSAEDVFQGVSVSVPAPVGGRRHSRRHRRYGVGGQEEEEEMPVVEIEVEEPGAEMGGRRHHRKGHKKTAKKAGRRHHKKTEKKSKKAGRRHTRKH